MATLKVIPDVIELIGLSPGVSQTIVVTIKNVENKTRTVRLRPPRTKWFSIHGFPSSVKLPPGLEQTFEVVFDGSEYQPGSTEAVQDKVIIQADNGDFELVLKSVVPRSDVHVEGDLQYGLLPVDSKASKAFRLVNKGNAPATYKLDWDKSAGMSVSPATGSLAAAGDPEGKDQCEITATLTLTDLGSASGDINVLVGDALLDGRKISYSATAVKQLFEVLDPHNVPVKEIDFGAHFFGEKLTRTITLFNNGPIEAKYFISYGSAGEMRARAEEDGGSGGVDDPDDPYADLILATRQKLRSQATNDNPFTIGPLSGSVAPYSKTTITLKFAPQDVPTRKGFTSQLPSSDDTTRIFDFLALFEFAGLPAASRIKLPVRGKGMAAALRAEPMSLDFGDVPTHDWGDQYLLLTNTNTSMPITYEAVKRNPYFEIVPPRGSILPGQNFQVVVRYTPKAMGSHTGVVPVHVLPVGGTAVVQELLVQVCGSSLRVGAKLPLVGGTDKLPPDFIKPVHYISEDQIITSRVTAHSKPSKSSLRLWDRPDISDAFGDIGPEGTALALGKDEFMALAQHKAKYVEAMRSRRTAREKAHLVRKVDDLDVDLGLDRHSGLKPFEPPLPKVVDPLWTFGSTQAPRPKQQRTISDHELEAIPFYKDRPAGEAERQACGRELTKEQISRLVIGPKVVDFGRVTVGSTSTQHLLFVNSLDQPLHVVLDLSNIPELKGSRSTAQVIPPGAHAKFPLTLRTLEMRSFNEKVDYCLNGSHVLSFSVAAQVVPVTVELNAEELHFEYSLDDWEQFLDKMLLLNNPHKFPVEYSIFSTSPDLFSVSPTSGTIKPQSSADVLVRWTPPPLPTPKDKGSKDRRAGGPGGEAAGDALMSPRSKDTKGLDKALGDSPAAAAAPAAGAVHEAYLVLTLTGGDQPRRVYLQAQQPEGALRLKDKALDGGSVALATPTTLTAQLKNTGTRASAFRVLPNDRVKISPERCKLAPDEVVDLEVSFICNEPGPLATTLEIQIQGGRTLKIPFKALGVVPHVEVDVDEFNFGQVYIGAYSKLPLVLTNTTSVPARLAVDLLKVPELQLAIGKDAWSPSEYDECPLQRIGAAGEMVAGGSRMGSATNSRRNSRASSSLGGFTGTEGSKFVITINPNAQLPLQLVYKPTAPGPQAWELAFLAAMTSEARMMAPMRRVVSAEGVKPRLVISKTSLDFGTRIVIRSNQVKAPYSSDIYFTNNQDDPVEVALGEPSGPDSSVFSLAPATPFMVNPGEMVGVTVQFCPRDNKSYEAVIPLYLGADRSAGPYMSLEVAGQGQHPRLTFDVRECLLPPVPLGITSSSTFHIVNNGYDNLELRYRLPADESHLPLKLSFPEGNLIGVAKERLPVTVSFESPKPVSFTASIDFLDEDGKRYSVPVSAAADNCLLTHQPFLQVNMGKLSLDVPDDESPIRLQPLQPPAQYELPPPVTALGPTTGCKAIVHFLNATTGRVFDPQLHTQLVTSKGKVLTELLELLSGKQVPGKVGRLPSNKKDAAEQLVAGFDACLQFLRAHGALLNAVKPEMLLDAEDFTRVLNARANRAGDTPEALEAVEAWADVEETFDLVSVQAWNAVISQIFKVFVLSRVTLKSFKSLPGMPGPPPPAAGEGGALGMPTAAPGTAPTSPGGRLSLLAPAESALTGSNLYSVPEGVLLAWATAHYVREFGSKAKRITNFEEDLRDGLALFSLLAGYWPAYSVRRASLAMGRSLSPADCNENAELVVRLMKDLGLPYDLSASDIADPSAKEMLVLLLYLYQTLPQFMPRTTVEFGCRLGETMVKELELSNPARKAIAYTARLEGHKDFSTEASLVRIDAKGTNRLPLKCTPTTSIPQEARLVLMSKRDGGGAHAATLVFLLRSAVNTRAPLKRVRTEGPLYEMQQFEFTVTNPFAADCDFIILLSHEPAEPLPKKEGEHDKKKSRRALAGGNGAKDLTPRSNQGGPSAAAAAARKLFPAAFGLDRLRIRLKGGASEKMRASFLPFTLGTHYCTILLKDKDQGEFAYELVGEATLPAPCLESRGVVPLEGPNLTYDLFVPFINPQLEAAKRTFLDKHPLAKDREQAGTLKTDPLKGLAELEYSVSQTNSLVSCGDRLVLSSGAAPPHSQDKGGAAPGKLGEPTPPGVLRLALKPLGTGIYPARILLTSTSGYDTRVIDLELTAQTMVQQFELMFECAVRQSIVQEVPLVNTSGQYMQVVATLSGSSKAYSGAREVSVPPSATVSYPLTFKPTAIGTHDASLELCIPSTGERNVYRLVGKAVEPVAESHVVLEVQARRTVTKPIAVPNIIGGPAEYQVLCDLDCVTGAEVIKLNSTQGTTYKLTAAPVRSGVYVGSLTFKAADGQYIWYSIEVRASEPPEVGTISVEAAVRTAVAISIPVRNPLDEDLTLSVHYSHPASLLGPQTLRLPARSRTGGQPTHLEAFFSPLLPGDTRGSILMVNEELGEFWYDIHMSATPAPPIALPPLKGELGRLTSAPLLRVANPTEASTSVSVTIKDVGPSPSGNSSSRPSTAGSRAFSVPQSRFTLAPLSEAAIELRYSPSSLAAAGGEPDRCVVVLESSDIGTWEYLVQGTGELPSALEPTNVTATLGSTGRASVSWRNPFPGPVTAVITLSGPGAASGELLLGAGASGSGAGGGPLLQGASSIHLLQQGSGSMQRAGSLPRQGSGRAPSSLHSLQGPVEREVAAGAEIQVPVVFAPKVLAAASADLTIRVSDPASGPSAAPLTWVYPVTGFAEVDATKAAGGSNFRFKTKARSMVEEVVEVVLTGLGAAPPGGELFSHDLVIPASAPRELGMPGVLSITPIGEPCITSPGQPLRYLLHFSPQSLYTTSVELVVTKPSGGRWRFELQLVASEPDSDGSLVLEAAMGSTCSTPIWLFSPSPSAPQPFTATFTPDTPLSFDVRPASGVLPPVPQQVLDLVPGAAQHGSPISLGLMLTQAANTMLVAGPQGSPAAAGDEQAATMGSTTGRRRRSTSPPHTQHPTPSVDPHLQGALSVLGSSEPPLRVTYTCRDFGKVLRGKLVVTTGGSQYMFELTGQMPSYVPPRPSDFAPSLDNRLSGSMRERLARAASTSRGSGRANFIQENIQSTRVACKGWAPE